VLREIVSKQIGLFTNSGSDHRATETCEHRFDCTSRLRPSRSVRRSVVRFPADAAAAAAAAAAVAATAARPATDRAELLLPPRFGVFRDRSSAWAAAVAPSAKKDEE